MIGGLSGDALTTGGANIALGTYSLGSDTKGNNSVAIGQAALTTQNFTTATDVYNVAVGHQAGTSVTTGQKNTLIGGLAGENLEGTSNIAVGYNALGDGAVNNASGYNIGIGVDAAKSLGDARFNVVIGGEAVS